MSRAPEFPPDVVAASVAYYGRETREYPDSKHRRNGRSFPTDYELPSAEETIADEIVRIAHEVDAYRGAGPRTWSQTRQSVAADGRVFPGRARPTSKHCLMSMKHGAWLSSFALRLVVERIVVATHISAMG